MDYPKGPDPYNSRQYLLHHMYSPLISIESTTNADVIIQSSLGIEDISILSILKPYGNNVKYPTPNQVFKITNNQLITKSYPSFPVRFEPLLPDLLSINSSESRNHQLFSISSLEMLLKTQQLQDDQDLYLYLFNKIVTSNLITPFETFNHPMAQIFIINYDNDSIEILRNKIVEFRNFNFPMYFQINDLLIHTFILYDETTTSQEQLDSFQNDIKVALSISSTCIPIIFHNPNSETSEIIQNENSTIDEEWQRITLEQNNTKCFNIPKQIDDEFRLKINEFISFYLIPHMQNNIRIWDDQVLSPKRSIASRFFSASRKLFNNSQELNANQYNTQQGYYHKSSPQQVIRKLADWSLILKDFKYSYSIYDFIKRDYINDKAWNYVASIQEMCMSSLLLVQTQFSNQGLDKNTLRKIRHDIIEPYLDNLSYTYKSRLNLKTYSLRTNLIVIELLLCMCHTYNMSWWWQDLIEKYLLKTINEFDNHLVSTNQKLQIIKAILLERLAYSFGKFLAIDTDINFESLKVPSLDPQPEHYVNKYKLQPKVEMNNFGFNRLRKSSLWYLMSIDKWLELGNLTRVEQLLENISMTYDIGLDAYNDNWYDRKDVILGRIKDQLSIKANE